MHNSYFGNQDDNEATEASNVAESPSLRALTRHPSYKSASPLNIDDDNDNCQADSYSNSYEPPSTLRNDNRPTAKGKEKAVVPNSLDHTQQGPDLEIPDESSESEYELPPLSQPKRPTTYARTKTSEDNLEHGPYPLSQPRRPVTYAGAGITEDIPEHGPYPLSQPRRYTTCARAKPTEDDPNEDLPSPLAILKNKTVGVGLGVERAKAGA